MINIIANIDIGRMGKAVPTDHGKGVRGDRRLLLGNVGDDDIPEADQGRIRVCDSRYR